MSEIDIVKKCPVCGDADNISITQEQMLSYNNIQIDDGIIPCYHPSGGVRGFLCSKCNTRWELTLDYKNARYFFLVKKGNTIEQ